MSARVAALSIAFRLNSVQFKYHTETVIDIEKLDIDANSSTVILGDNGAGKTTLINLIGLIQSPLSGEIYCGNQRVTSDNRFELRRRIATLHQRPYLFRGSVLHNVMLGLKLRGINHVKATAKANLALQMAEMDHLAQRSTRALSGGEAQRVALARCLVTNPDVLVMDEPFSHLDQGSLKAILQTVQDYQVNGGTVVFSTHDQRHWKELAECVVELDQGRITSRYRN
ncbi:MAG: energy-coupling factor ABC transporter ATP-binding protein [Gammaproteobacteria bacterium]|nr:energy-coupling factor ABC transporter ATP-binding protein [Gammaproteobacteria bacterium]